MTDTQNKAFDDINEFIDKSKAVNVFALGALAGVLVYAEIYLLLLIMRIVNLISQVLLSGLNNAFLRFLKEILLTTVDLLASTWMISLIPIFYGALLSFLHWICSRKGWCYEARYGSKYRPYSTAMLISCILGPFVFILTIGVFVPNMLMLSIILCPFSGFCTYLAWEKPFYKMIVRSKKRSKGRTEKQISS